MMLEMKVLPALSGEVLKATATELLMLIQEVFPEKIVVDYSMEFLEDNLSDRSAINIIAVDQQGVIRAYLLAVSLSKARKDLLKRGVHMSEDIDDEKVYVDTLVSNTHNRIFIKLVNTMMRIAWQRNKKAIGMHARINTGFADIIATLFPVEPVEEIPDFLGYGEPFVYLEGNLDSVQWLQPLNSAA